MGRVKVAACKEAATDWTQLSAAERTSLIKMYPPAVHGTTGDMAAAIGRSLDDMTPAEIVELQRVRTSMRGSCDRMRGAGVVVIGAATLLDE